MLDFGMLPPEVNSTLMYTGAGSSSLVAAAEAWNALADDLHATVIAEQQIVSQLTSAWTGVSAADMFSAVQPYIAWVTTSSEHAHQTAAAATNAVSAYETAFAATVPPTEVLANRTLLVELIATNLLGQNTAAIMQVEAQYSEMWAQDVAAMYSYQSESAAAVAQLPVSVAAPATVSGSTATAATSAAATPAAGILADLNQLFSFMNNSNDVFGINANIWNTLASAGVSPAYLAPVLGQLAMMQQSNDLTAEGNRISQQLEIDDEQQHNSVNPAEAPVYPQNSPRISERPTVGARTGSSAGFLSVPPAWEQAAKGEVRLTSAAQPLTTPALGGATPSMIPTPIAAVSAPKKDRKHGEEILVSVRFVPDKGL